MSLAEPIAPSTAEIPADSNVEMSWKVFCGPYDEIIASLLVDHYRKTQGADKHQDVLIHLRRHIHRGIGYLLSSQAKKIGGAAQSLLPGNNPGISQRPSGAARIY